MQQNILVVDDEAIARRFMERALTEAGYRVMLANDGEQALDLIRTTRRKIALVVTDLVMPGMGGHAFALEVGKLPSPPLFTLSPLNRRQPKSSVVSRRIAFRR